MHTMNSVCVQACNQSCFQNNAMVNSLNLSKNKLHEIKTPNYPSAHHGGLSLSLHNATMHNWCATGCTLRMAAEFFFRTWWIWTTRPSPCSGSGSVHIPPNSQLSHHQDAHARLSQTGRALFKLIRNGRLHFNQNKSRISRQNLCHCFFNHFTPPWQGVWAGEAREAECQVKYTERGLPTEHSGSMWKYIWNMLSVV